MFSSKIQNIHGSDNICTNYVDRIIGNRIWTGIPSCMYYIIYWFINRYFFTNILLQYMAAGECFRMDDSVTFSDIADYLPLEKHKAESFRFIPQDMPAAEMEDIFAQAQKAPKRLGLLFVTQNGQPTEKLLGMISAWDMAGVD